MSNEKSELLKLYDVVVLKHGNKWKAEITVGVKCPECENIVGNMRLPFAKNQEDFGYLICSKCKCEFKFIKKG